MKPAPFRYLRPASLDEALALKAEHGDAARFLAGGQSLVPAMNFRLAQPAVLIDINRLAVLAFVREEGGALHIGALTRNRALERDPLVARAQTLLAEAIPHVSHPQIRTRGTIGGNLAHADPASELPAVMLALGARLRARSASGERWIAARDFFVGTLATALRPDEMLVEIALPDLPPRTGTAFIEVARRRGDYALMGVAALVTRDAAGRCVRASIACCSAGDTPLLAADAGAALERGASATEAAALVRGAVRPHGSVHGSADYQRYLAGVIARRALDTAFARAA